VRDPGSASPALYRIHARGKSEDADSLEQAVGRGRVLAHEGECAVAVTRRTGESERPIWCIWADEGGSFRQTRTPKYVEQVKGVALTGRGKLPS
jgi:hypothetical protein